MTVFPMNDADYHRIQQRATLYRQSNSAFARWAEGYGVIKHNDLTQVRVHDLCDELVCQGRFRSLKEALDIFMAADRVSSAALWLVVHMTYAKHVFLNGRPLEAEHFKANPQGHTGGSLNMVPAYVGYLTANTLTGITRSWLMGQGHCVAAIDSVNVITGNLLAEQAQRYHFSDEGLSTLTQDFYAYRMNAQGRPEAPLGSHVNAHTAGGLIEGGYLGFAELQYVHMPLPGEQLVAFLSDGAFEEQRGSDWAGRWWRAEDCGLVSPIMIANGRRIDQRATLSQQGGVSWLYRHLENNGFYPQVIDGRDPAAFVWAIFESEARLLACSAELAQGRMCYPVALPYTIAETEKGYGFYGAGTNAAHGTPLPGNPAEDAGSRELFNTYAAKLWVEAETVNTAVTWLNNHDSEDRVPERDHPLTRREVRLENYPTPDWQETDNTHRSPMSAIDRYFTALVRANPSLRVRVSNPDELRSNRMDGTLDLLKHRVTAPEAGVAEAIDGAVITALNEEAVISAALANKGGINLAVSYEAFAVKMLGALRQEIIFSRHQQEVGHAPRWLSVPVIATSHQWENGKNEQSHQDSTFGEALLAEMNDTSRVLYPADWNSALATMEACYHTRGQLWSLTVPKQAVATVFTPQQAKRLVQHGAQEVVNYTEHGPSTCQLVATGAYQLQVCLAAAQRLQAKQIACSVCYLIEPGKFRAPRDDREARYVAPDDIREALFPAAVAQRIFVTHTRPEAFLGAVRPLDLGAEKTVALGYRNRGGTLDTEGLLYANHSQVIHVLASYARLTARPYSDLLTSEELAVLNDEVPPPVNTHGRQ